MGIFSRDSGSGTDRRKSGRSTDAQASELRVRARRRLVGALVLVVAAVIVVPMLIDTNPPANDAVQPIVLPPVASAPEGQFAAAGSSNGSITIEQVDIPSPSSNVDEGAGNAGSSEPRQAMQPAESGETQAATGNQATPSASAAEPERQAETSTGTTSGASGSASNQSGSATPSSAPAPNTRSDDGEVALALLEGRQPPSSGGGQSTSSASGSFVLQIAAYTTEQDANARRDKLLEAGVNNAFVESATSGGKPTYRLRVGPFPSREAAQAAQTRLRALGYDNGFISSK